MIALVVLFLLLSFNADCVCADQKAQNDEHLNIGIYRPSLSNYVDLADIEISLKYWLREVTHDLAIQTTETYFFENYQDLSESFSKGDIDVFVAPPLAVVMYFDKELLAEGFYNKGNSHEGDALLLLARSKVIEDLGHLAGKKLILPANDKLAEFFLETVTLETSRKALADIFPTIVTAKKMNRIILSLFFGHSDVAVVYKSSYEVMVEMNAQINSRIKILKSFPVLSKNIGFIRKNLFNRTQIIENIRNFSIHPRGRQIMNVFQCSAVGIVSTKALVPFEHFYQNYLALKNQWLINKL